MMRSPLRESLSDFAEPLNTARESGQLRDAASSFAEILRNFRIQS